MYAASPGEGMAPPGAFAPANPKGLPLPAFPIPVSLASKKYNELMHPNDWLYGLQIRFDTQTSESLCARLAEFPMEALSRAMEQQWQAHANLLPREEGVAPAPLPRPTLFLAFHRPHVILTIGWPRHFTASALTVQSCARECIPDLEALLQYLADQWHLRPPLFGPWLWIPPMYPRLSSQDRRFIRTLCLINTRLNLPEDLLHVIISFFLRAWRLQWHNKYGMGCLPPVKA
eukprot:TRINITY_DN923_c0_g1_i1.p2 TRINITY_DN923_c0_g1~~TRINITY_DN923_c0_g1_i1.p2  ORF type:complete len:238 (-),score=32.87 TRINITY_DN923_c0_g1_i1:333-1025(-)